MSIAYVRENEIEEIYQCSECSGYIYVPRGHGTPDHDQRVCALRNVTPSRQLFAINVLKEGEEDELLRDNNGEGAVLYFNNEQEAATYAGIESITEVFDENVDLKVILVEVRDNFSTTTEESPHEEWDAMTRAIDSGRRIQISEEVYRYFLEVLPPCEMFKGGFLFAEGDDYLRRFTREKDGYFAERTNTINTEEATE